MSEENINKLNYQDKQFLGDVVSRLANAFLIKLLIKKGVVTADEINANYDLLKELTIEDFAESHKLTAGPNELKVLYAAYLETVEVVRETVMSEN